jgi:glycine hydroxymethyltransferase
MKESEMEKIAVMINDCLRDIHNEKRIASIRQQVKMLCDRFPLYADRLKQAL